MSKLISDKIEKTMLTVNAIKKNINLVEAKGINNEFISGWEKDCNELEKCDKELDQLKDAIKNKKREMSIKSINLRAKIQSAKKTIKTNFEKEQWKTFGITDKR